MKKYFLALTLFLLLLALLTYPVRAEAATVTLTVNKNGNGKVSSLPPRGSDIDCGTDCSEGGYDPAPANRATVTLRAEADPGFAFAGWLGDCTNNAGDCSVTMDDNKVVTANFAPLWRSPFYNPPNCIGLGGRGFDPACWLPINVSPSSQIKIGALSVGSPSLGGLIVDAGAYIRGNLVLPLPDNLTQAQKTAKIGNVLTLMDSKGTAGWAPLSLTCENVSTSTPATKTWEMWKTATTTPCSAGYKVTGGGVRSVAVGPDTDPLYSESYKSPSSEAWVGRLRGRGFDATVYARCCKLELQ